jgi:general secretion pathway protein C
MATLPSIDPPRAALPGQFLVVALTLALAWQLAYWTWVFVAPPAVAPAAAPRPDIDLAAVARLFGAAAPASAGGASASGLRLKGVIAPTPGVAASAIFSTGSGKDIAVFVDGDVQPGVKLVEVDPDHVMVSRGGVRERIDLEARRSVAAVGPAGGVRGAQGFRINVARAGDRSYAFSRHELDEALRDPGQLNYLGQLGMPTGGGVRMEQAPPGSLAQKLGLQPGDVIRRVNGQAVASTGDLARLYTQFNTLSSIQAEVVRGGQTVTLVYAIQP